ncbi:heparinase II/III-like protein [Paenibacillus sp. BK033]|nr:heparinase II/III-like protein [Paenibacillus sp. BK033]
MVLRTEYREKLEALVNRAKEILESRREYYTDGAKLALEDMLQAAQQALDGTTNLPFSRSREFYVPREDEAIPFAAKRFTMVPPFKEEGDVYTHYGLETAIEWFEKQELLGSEDMLLSKAELAITKANELLSGIRYGDEVGFYNKAAGNKLLDSLQVLVKKKECYSSGNPMQELARAVVDCFNRIRELRHSRVLRTDVEPTSTLYLDQEGLRKVKSMIESDVLIRKQYEEISRISDHYSLNYIENAVSMLMNGASNYEELNRHFYLWSSTDKIVNFRTPEGAVQATLSFILPSEDNEQDGLGHVWIDNLDILSASGGSLTIGNRGFDAGAGKPDDWVPEARKGRPIMKWEDKYPYCGGGDRYRLEPANTSSQANPRYREGDSRRSLYICNPTKEDEGSWHYEGTFAVESDAGYTLTFEAKLDGKLKKGLNTVITFLDDEGKAIGTFDYVFNRKSHLPGGRFQMAMQCDAIRYAVTGESVYAQKVKHALLYILNDFCQGAEHWLVTNLRPEGSDSYGAVQGGRLLSSAAVSYSFIKQAEVFSDAEKKRFYGMVEYLLRYMLDLRDRTEWTAYDAQAGCTNWQTDMCAGTGFMMMVLNDFPNRHTWLYNANTILKAQLELNVNPDSSWPESIRYHHAALERFAGYAKVLQNVQGENWFEITPLTRMFGFSIEMQTPAYEYFSGRIGTPPFGDHALGGGEEFGSFAVYLEDVEKVDRRLADRMYHTWVAAGKPYKKLWGEGIALENIMGPGDLYVPTRSLELSSTDQFPQAGIYIFRNRFGERNQSYFAIMSSPEPIGHGHLDQGSFILYKNSIPLVMDSGIEGYFDSSTSWHISSYSHSCLQFATKFTNIPKQGTGAINLSAGTYSLERGWADVPRTSRVLEVTRNDSVESITIEILNPEGKGRHIRHVSFVKSPELYVIRDTVEDFDNQVLFTLPVASKRSVLNGNRIYSHGVYGLDLETAFLTPLHTIRLEKGRSTPFFDSGEEETCMMDYIRAVADAKDGFLTLLHPKEQGQPEMQVDILRDGTVTIQAQDKTIRLVRDHYGVRLIDSALEGVVMQ